MPSEILEKTITRGDIILSDVDFVNHKKFFVVMGVSKDKICGVFIINSNINRKISGKQNLLDMQYSINKNDYTFLSHTSIIDCSDLFEYKITEIVKKLSENKAKAVGTLKEDDMNIILERCRESRLFNKIEKDNYFYNMD